MWPTPIITQFVFCNRSPALQFFLALSLTPPAISPAPSHRGRSSFSTVPASVLLNWPSTTSEVRVLLIANSLARLFKLTARVPQSSTRQQPKSQPSFRTLFPVAQRRSGWRTRGKPRQQFPLLSLLPLPESLPSIPRARGQGPASIRTARLTQRLPLQRLAMSSPATRQVKARPPQVGRTENPLRFRCPNQIGRA